MLTLKSIHYTYCELTALRDAIDKAHTEILRKHCKCVPCATCDYKHVCDAVARLARHVDKVIEQRENEQ